MMRMKKTKRMKRLIRSREGPNGKDEGRDGDVGIYFNRNSIVPARGMTIEYG